MSTAFDVPSVGRWIPELGAYIPAWYVPHPDATLKVTAGGSPLGSGFTIAEVLPTRRWAIGLDGEVMPQRDFEDKYIQYLQGMPGIDRGHDPRNDHIPRVEAYVQHTYSVNIGWHDIGYDPYKRPDAAPQPKWNQQGELSEHYLRERDEKAGTLARFDLLKAQLENGEITPEQYIERTGVKVVSLGTPEEPMGAPALEAARCGKQVKRGYVVNHERRCKACISLAEASTAA